VLQCLPRFERNPFVIHSSSCGYLESPDRDVIIRLPSPLLPESAIVGTVSKRYQLVQHSEIVERVALRVMETSRHHDLGPITAHLSPDGAKMNFYVPLLSGEESFDPGDNHPLGLRLVGVNSVDRSTSFRVFLGWLRFVCSNGMISGTIEAEYHKRHTQALQLDEVDKLLTESFDISRQDKAMFRHWHNTPITPLDLESWIDTVIKPAWGAVSATRAFHIITSGHDVEIVRANEPVPPSEKSVRYLDRVPGSETPAENLYAVSQALTWIATRQPTLEQRLQWQKETPALVNRLAAPH
jgi:hypothetical protein